MDFLADYDCVWLATDDQGAVAAMVTAGSGVVPASVLSGTIEVTEIESALLTLSEIGEVTMLIKGGDPSSFIALGRRGLFVYDWTDVYRTSSEICAYELVVSPDVPISFSELPKTLRSVAMPLDTGTLIGAPTVRVC